MHTISVIIPALNEEKNIKNCIESAKNLNPIEIIVVDGGSSDRTVEVAKNNGAIVIASQKGRGIQMNMGASVSEGDVFLFLHADARLTDIGQMNTESLLNGCIGGFFRLSFDDNSISARLVEFFANMRARLLSLPYGDQALFIRRDVFEDIGGFREYPFLEDIDIALRLRKIGRLRYINHNVVVSSRRIQKGYPLSPILISLRNVMIALLFILGASPCKLIRLYK